MAQQTFKNIQSKYIFFFYIIIFIIIFNVVFQFPIFKTKKNLLITGSYYLIHLYIY